MSTQLPTHSPQTQDPEIQKMIDQVNAEERGTGFRPLRKVAVINKDRFWLTVPGTQEPIAKFDTLSGHVIASKIARAMYTTKDQKAPSCSSRDGGLTGMLNLEVINQTQVSLNIPDGQKCFSCPFNEWGSAIDEHGNPGKGKACKERRNLLMVVEEFREPIVLSLSPSSLGVWDAYADTLASQGDSYITKTVKVSIKTETKGQNEFGVAIFTTTGSVDRETIKMLFDVRQQYAPLIGAIQMPTLVEAGFSEPDGAPEQVEEKEIPF